MNNIELTNTIISLVISCILFLITIRAYIRHKKAGNTPERKDLT